MPSLGKHDPLALEPATKEDVNQARRLAETVLPVNGILLQFDNISRQRMRDVSAMDSDADIEWFTYDNKPVTYTRSQFFSLFRAAEEAIGPRTLAVFARAKELKAKIDAGEFVSKAELRLDCWNC